VSSSGNSAKPGTSRAGLGAVGVDVVNIVAVDVGSGRACGPGAPDIPGLGGNVEHLLPRQAKFFDGMLVHPGVGLVVACLLGRDGAVDGKA
jgi:hypothetical protein